MAQLTPEQFANLAGGSTADIKPISTPAQTEKKPKGFLGRLGSGLSEAFGKRAENVSQSFQADQSFGSKALQTVGQVAGGIQDVVTETAQAGFESLPQGVQSGAKNVGLSILQTPVGKVAVDALQGGMETWNRFKEADPETAKNIEAVINIGSIIPIGKGAQLAGRGAMEVAETGLEVAQKGARATGELVETAKKNVGAGLATIPEQMRSQFRPTELIPEEKLSLIPEKKITSQKEQIAQKFEEYVTAGEKHAKDIKQKSPLTVAGDKATEALSQIQTKLKKQAELKKEALGEVGNKVVSGVKEFKDMFAKKLQDEIGVVYDAKKGTFKDAAGRISKISLDPADNRLLRGVNEVFEKLGDSPTVNQIDDAVDAIQDILYKRKQLTQVPVNSQVEGLLKNVTGKLNSTVKKVGGKSYTTANSKYAKFIDTFNKLNDALGPEGERGAALMKKLFSPAGESPRRLFEEVKDLTGIDLTQEASFAKFVMESLGDVKQKSLLEATLGTGVPTPTGVLGTLIEKGVSKVVNPIEKARKLIKK